MLLSLITPTHNPAFLHEAYLSLLRQNFKNWEWVILPNGKDTTIPDSVTQDKRVRVIESGRLLHNVGALKKTACDHAKGDVFIEFDHDDLLVPGKSLSTIADLASQGAGFIYSDVAVFKQNESTRYGEFIYSPQHGWTSYPIKVYGKRLLATRSFAISPRSLAEIYYAPDHVRCWSREAYYKAGGHNPELSVCDDHELMVKTYLSGAKFMHTGNCLYLYRMFDSNTVILRSQLIRDTTRKLKRKYLPSLIEEWCKRNNFDKASVSDLRKAGWSADKHLEQGFGEDRYGHIVANAELQKLEGWQVREFMNKAYTALKPGGYLTVIVPDAANPAAYVDVEWKSRFGEHSMFPYTRTYDAKVNGNITCRFQHVDRVKVFPSDWHKNNDFGYHMFFLCALKGQQQPALQEI